MSFNVASAAGARRVGKSKYFASRVESEAFCPSALKNLFKRGMEVFLVSSYHGALQSPPGLRRTDETYTGLCHVAVFAHGLWHTCDTSLHRHLLEVVLRAATDFRRRRRLSDVLKPRR